MGLPQQIVQVYEESAFSDNAFVCDMKYLYKCVEHQGLKTIIWLSVQKIFFPKYEFSWEL